MNKVKYLLTYRYAEIIHDLTVEFTKAYLMGNLSTLRNLSNLSQKADYRQVDQMNQAARSGKQNIVEGVGQSQTSKSGEIKLLGVSEASFEELLSDFEDFLRQKNLSIWPKDHPKIRAFRDFRAVWLKPNIPNTPNLPKNAEEAANMLLTFIQMETFLLKRQIDGLIKKFIEQGGFRENLFKKRLAFKDKK